MQLNVNEFVLTKLDPECGLAQPQLVNFKSALISLINLAKVEIFGLLSEFDQIFKWP